MAYQVTVVGSFSQDLVTSVPRLPAKGETIRGTDFGMFAGGKGNNQAMAAARAGASVAMIGRVGQDQFGDMLIDTLKKNSVDAKHVVRDEKVGTGIALITVGADGDNSIVIAQRANLALCPEDIAQAKSVITNSRVLLMQLEVPFAADIAAAETAHRAGVTVILNPAPAPEDGKLPVELLRFTDIIVPNQTEAQLLTGIPVKDKESAIKAAQELRKLGPKQIIITLGEMGALLLEENSEALLIPSCHVKAIDTTAAGDAFCGALAAAYAEGKPLAEAVKFGCAAGALATTIMGAEPSLPRKIEIEELLFQACKK